MLQSKYNTPHVCSTMQSVVIIRFWPKYGPAYATGLRLSAICCLSVKLCIVAKRCVLEQKLLLTAYMKPHIGNRFLPKWTALTFV